MLLVKVCDSFWRLPLRHLNPQLQKCFYDAYVTLSGFDEHVYEPAA